MTYVYRVNSNQITEVTAPTVEPISLTTAKAHLKIDGTDEDTLITAMIKAARQWLEKEYQISLVQRTYRADVEGFADIYHLPRPPFNSLTSVKYYTDDSPQVLTTLDSNYYRADPGRSEIYIESSVTTIPNVANRRDAVQITWVAGVDPDSSSPLDYTANVDGAIKAALLLQISELYERRSVNSEMRLQKTPTIDMLLARWREY